MTLKRAAAQLALAIVLVSPLSFAQPPLGEEPLRAFESASVRPSHPVNGPIISVSAETRRFSARGVSLRRLVGFAYDVDISRVVGGPEWVDSSYYEIEAAVPAAAVSVGGRIDMDEIRRLVEGLLLDHFGLVAHEQGASLAQVVIDEAHPLPPDLGRGRLSEPPEDERW